MKNYWIGVTFILALVVGCGGQTGDPGAAGEAPAAGDSSAADAGNEGEVTPSAVTATEDDLPVMDDAESSEIPVSDVSPTQETADVTVAENTPGEDAQATPGQIKAAINEKLVAALQARDIDGAMAILEDARAQLPEDQDIAQALLRFSLQRDLQMAQANADQEALAGNFLKTAALGEEVLGAEKSEDPQIAQMQSLMAFNKARALALEGNTAEAVAALRQAGDYGFDQFRGLGNDPFLKAIAENAEFTQLVDEMTEKVREKFRESAREEIAQSPEMEFDFELPDLENNPVKLGDFAGKVVIVDFWGTWCPPCRMEIPHFIELKEKFKDDLEIVGISYENGDEAEKVKIVSEFVEANGVNYPCVMGDEATQAAVQITGFPTTLFIDREGKVRLKIVGYHPYLKLESYVAELIGEGKESS